MNLETFNGVKISQTELNHIKKLANKLGCLYIEDYQYLDNLTLDKNDATKWNLRISKISQKDLINHKTKYFTDGNNNGKTLVINRLK